MKLEIVSPEKHYFSGEVTLVTLPGKSGMFTILENHAPIIAALDKGKLVYKPQSLPEGTLTISGGFVEVSNNRITVCIEKAE